MAKGGVVPPQGSKDTDCDLSMSLDCVARKVHKRRRKIWSLRLSSTFDGGFDTCNRPDTSTYQSSLIKVRRSPIRIRNFHAQVYLWRMFQGKRFQGQALRIFSPGHPITYYLCRKDDQVLVGAIIVRESVECSLINTRVNRSREILTSICYNGYEPSSLSSCFL